MEDYEAQEVEFWAQARRGGHEPLVDAAAQRCGSVRPDGPRRREHRACGATRARSRAPPTQGTKAGSRPLVADAKKEGHLNTIALPPDWANYGEMISTFQKKYGIKITNDNPDGSSAQENQAIRSLKGDSRAPDVVDVGVSFAISGANEGLYAKYFNVELQDDPARAEGHARLLDGRLLGRDLDRLQHEPRQQPARRRGRTC